MAKVTITTKLPDSNNDGVIAVSAAGAKRYDLPHTGNWWVVADAPDFTYDDRKADVPPVVVPPPPVEPPVVAPPTPSVGILNAQGENHLVSPNGKASAGFNTYGALGTLYAAPVGVPTDLTRGRNRVGYFDGAAPDLILPGRAIEGFLVEVAGKRYANFPLTGFNAILGRFVDGVWSEEVAGLGIEQHQWFDANGALHISVTLENNSDKPARYIRAADFDGDSYVTASTVIKDGWRIVIDGKRTYTWMMAGGEASREAAPNGYFQALTAKFSALPIGSTKKADDVIALSATVPAGETKTLEIVLATA